MTRSRKITSQAGFEPWIFRFRGGRLNHQANEAVRWGKEGEGWGVGACATSFCGYLFACLVVCLFVCLFNNSHRQYRSSRHHRHRGLPLFVFFTAASQCWIVAVNPPPPSPPTPPPPLRHHHNHHPPPCPPPPPPHYHLLRGAHRKSLKGPSSRPPRWPSG